MVSGNRGIRGGIGELYGKKGRAGEREKPGANWGNAVRVGSSMMSIFHSASYGREPEED